MGVDASHVGSYVGGYKIKKVLGEGRLGLVFRARAQDEVTALAQGGDVIFRAIRGALCERPEFRANFNVMLPLVAMLDHPGIVRHIDAMELPDGQLVLIEELVDGTPLSQLMGHGAPMPWSRALTIIEPLLGAMAHAKAREVVHGAVTPHNVLIRTSDEQVMLLDYGVAAAELGPGLAWMAPELLPIGPGAMLMSVRPASPPTERSDVYSVGMMLFVMLTGNYPWGGNTKPREIVEQKLNGDFTRVDVLNPTLPPALGAVVDSALERDPDKRIGSVTELSRALTQAVEPAIGQWVRPGRTITREKQFVAQRLEEALARRNEPRTRSSASMRSVQAVAGSSHSIEAIHSGEADPREVARIAHAREAWARRTNRTTARNWAYGLSALSGPGVMAAIGLFIAAGVAIPVPEDWLVFVGPSVVFYFLGAWLGLKSGLRARTRTDFAVIPRAIVSPVVSILVLFVGDWLLDVTNLGGGLDSGPRTAVLLAVIWSANALIGCWTADRLNRVVEQIAVEERLPPAARATGRHHVV
jgi:serine/threonine protein kinase